MKTSWAEIDLRALEENIHAVRGMLRPATEIMFVVKADAYGHGLVPVAQRAWAAGVRRFAVAYLREALALRCALDQAEILVLGVAEATDVPELLARRIVPIVADLAHGSLLSAAAIQSGARLPVHVKLDTGMGRIGVMWAEMEGVLPQLCRLPGLDIQGVCSHFAAVLKTQPERARSQQERFQRGAAILERELGRRVFRHIASSRAALFHASWHLDAIRPGMLLYGYGATTPQSPIRTRPILQWKTNVVQVKAVPAGFPVSYGGTYVTARPTEIATLALGYADGYLRTLSNRGWVLIRGRRCPVVGRVTMNWITVDVGPASGVQSGDEAVLIGCQDGGEIWAGELSRLCETIPYEILTQIHPAVERRYLY